VTWKGSVFSKPAAVSTASAPVPFWSPTFSVTADRFVALAAGLDEDDEDEEAADDEEDDEHPAAASPVSARARAA
jgi:hypothetical protein